MPNAFHPSIEGAQHGAKSLEQFLDYAKASGAAGAQPSNYMLGDGKGGLRKAKDIKATFESRGMRLDGVSAHCPFWVHTSAWTGTKSGNPFIPPDVASQTPEKIEKWHETYILKLLDLAHELGIKTVPMFWGVAFGWEVATGYPWGFWSGAGFDLVKEGQERFVKKTAKIRRKANELGLKLCHEIHPGTGAMCADDFLMLVQVCDNDPLPRRERRSVPLLGRRVMGNAVPEGREVHPRRPHQELHPSPRPPAPGHGATLAEAWDAVHRPSLRRPQHAALRGASPPRRIPGPLLQASRLRLRPLGRRSRIRAP